MDSEEEGNQKVYLATEDPNELQDSCAFVPVPLQTETAEVLQENNSQTEKDEDEEAKLFCFLDRIVQEIVKSWNEEQKISKICDNLLKFLKCNGTRNCRDLMIQKGLVWLFAHYIITMDKKVTKVESLSKPGEVLMFVIQGKLGHAMNVISTGVVTKFIMWAFSKNPSLIILAVRFVQVLAAHGKETRDLLVNERATDALIRFLKDLKNKKLILEVQREAEWLLENILRALLCLVKPDDSPPLFELADLALPYIPWLLQFPYENVLRYTCRVFSFSIDGNLNKLKFSIPKVISGLMTDTFLQMIPILYNERNRPRVVLEVLRIMSRNITAKSDQMDIPFFRIINAQALFYLVKLLDHNNRCIKIATINIMSGIIKACTEKEIQPIINKDLFNSVNHLLKSEDSDIQIGTIRLVQVFVEISSVDQFKILLSFNVIENILNKPSPSLEMNSVILVAFQTFLKVSQKFNMEMRIHQIIMKDMALTKRIMEMKTWMSHITNAMNNFRFLGYSEDPAVL